MSTMTRNGEIVSRPPLEFPAKPIGEMSSRERSQLMDDTVKQVAHLIEHAQGLSAQVAALAGMLDITDRDLRGTIARLNEVERVIALRHRRTATFWQRLRWIVQG